MEVIWVNEGWAWKIALLSAYLHGIWACLAETDISRNPEPNIKHPKPQHKRNPATDHMIPAISCIPNQHHILLFLL